MDETNQTEIKIGYQIAKPVIFVDDRIRHILFGEEKPRYYWK